MSDITDAGGTVDQSAIDAMFGFADADKRQARTGLRALLEADMGNRERLPMLEVVCERMVRTFATSMRNLTSDALDVHLAGVATSRFGDVMNRLRLPAMIGVFHVREWDDYGAITVNSGLIYAVVDSLLGGRRGSPPPRIEGRAFTPIETMLVGKMIQQTLDDFAASFEAIEPITLTLERMEATPRFAAIAGPSNLTAVATFDVDMEGRGGTFDILLPYATIEPVREKLVQRFVGEKLGRDGLWETHITRELLASAIVVDAIFGETTVALHDFARWEVGQTIALDRRSDDPLDIACNGTRLGQADIGTRAGMVAVQMRNEIATGASG